MSTEGVERCSCDEALALRRELAEETLRASRLEARLKREQEALTIAENSLAKLLPLRQAVGKLAKENVRLQKQVKASDGAIDDLRQALRRREQGAA
jgi:hypothetical protein